MKKALQILACGALVLTLAGCGEVPKMKNGEDAVVSFKDSKLDISVSDLYKAMLKDYGVSYTVKLIDTNILNTLYEKDDAANAYLQKQVETYEGYYGGEQKFLELLQQNGYNSIEDFKDNLFLDYQRDLATKDYIKKNLTDKDIQKFYDTNIHGDITASHILITVDDEDDLTDDEKTEAEKSRNEKIKTILDKLNEAEDVKTTFAELAEQYSDDEATKKNGGKIGTFNNESYATDKDFYKAVSKLEVGKYTTTAVKTENGYHIILKEAEKEKPALNDVKDFIIDQLVDEELKDNTKAQYQALIDLRKNYGIEINDKDLSEYYDRAVNNWLYGKED